MDGSVKGPTPDGKGELAVGTDSIRAVYLVTIYDLSSAQPFGDQRKIPEVHEDRNGSVANGA